MSMFLLLMLTLQGCTERRLSSPTTQMDLDPNLWIRVLLIEKTKICRFRSESTFSIIDANSQSLLAEFGPTTVSAAISLTDNRISINGKGFSAKELIVSSESPHIFSLNGDHYRGKLKITVNPNGLFFDAVNLVPPEPYLAGVVGVEMYDYWENAALEAQAIAARTYCMFIKNKFGPNRHWDLKKTQSSQVYRGLCAESARIWRAVNKTRGQVLLCRNPNGKKELLPAYYSSACGGHTENSKNVSGITRKPLAGVRCTYCQDISRLSLFFWPTAEFDKDRASRLILNKYPKLKPLQKITNITAARVSDYGSFSRLTLIKLTGSNGKTGYLRAEDLRLTLDPTGLKFKSTICQIADLGKTWAFISGRGFGHGVGLCQCGAEGMARDGKNAAQILSHYYPGSEISKIDYKSSQNPMNLRFQY
jgi:stage II sporulation protein D